MSFFASRLALVFVAMLAACAPSPPTNGHAPAAAPPVAAEPDAALDMPGYVYAANHCAACHAIRRGQILSPNPDATPFETIANTPGMTGYALTVWLNTSHPTMPNFVVEADRIEDVWAYMATLRK